jgi:copper(I)-binding protein
MRRLSVAALLCLALPASAEVTVTDAWVRGTVPSQNTTGAFLTITSTENAKLVGVSTPIAGEAGIHKTENHGGMMHMEEVKAIDLPANRAVPLQPGGYHVMLMSLKGPVKAGAKVPIKLVIEDAKGKRTTVAVEAAVKPLGE